MKTIDKMDILTKQQFIQHLRVSLKKRGDKKKVSRKLGYHDHHIAHVIADEGTPSDKLANEFGYKRIVAYVPMNEQEKAIHRMTPKPKHIHQKDEAHYARSNG